MGPGLFTFFCLHFFVDVFSSIYFHFLFTFLFKCCDCNQWRYLNSIEDPSQVPEIWICIMNDDPDYDSCEIPEDPDTHTNQYVDGNFVVGTVKWIKLANFPKWPGFIGKK